MKPFLRYSACVALALFAVTPDSSAQVALPTSTEGQPGSGPIRQKEWFRKLWEKRRGEWAIPATIQADQGAVVFFGDSITQGWERFGLETAFDEMPVANRGISGDTTRGMLIRLEEDVLSLNPSAVVMLMGTNDLEEAAPVETTISNVSMILTAIHAHDKETPVVLNLVFPSSVEKDRPADKIKAMNAGLIALAKEWPNVTVVDTWTLFADENGDAPEAQFPDLLHPNERGYQSWTKALRPIFATLGFIETESDDFEMEEGFVSLFNEEDLTGWGFRKTAPRKTPKKPRPDAPTFVNIVEDESFIGKTTSSDGRYRVIGDRLVVTTPVEGRRIQQLWTLEEFPMDFVLRLEFRATPNADSGVFIRKPQLQCRDYLTAGPYTDLKSYRPQEWNKLEVTVTGNTAVATCNGELIESAMELPPTGPIGLEGDRGQMEYRHIRIKKITE